MSQSLDGDASCKELYYDQCMYKVCQGGRLTIKEVMYTRKCSIGTGKPNDEVIWLCCAMDKEQ